jgi:hypothetical protein
METICVTRYALCVGFALVLTLAPQFCGAQSDTSPSTTSELAKRVADLEKQLADLKTQLATQKPVEAAPPAAEKPPATEAPAAAATTPAPAAAPAPTGLAALLGPTTLSGFVDAYYGYNANQPASRTNALRNFDINSGQFGLNMLELIADKATDPTNRVGYHVALGFGQAMNLVNSGEVGSPNIPGTPLGGPAVSNFDQYLKEGYLEYLAPAGKGLKIDVGKFVTNAGSEVIESKDNWNYSRGLLFSWAIPYFHFGARASYSFNNKVSVSASLVNGWNNSVDNNTGKTVGFSLTVNPSKKWSIIENYYGGPEHANYNGSFRNLSDTVITYTPNAKLSLMANYDYGRDHLVTSAAAGVPPFFVGPRAVWSGLAGYLKYAFNDKYAIALRGEYFDDNQGFATGTSQELNEFTATFQRTIAKAIISRLEFRRDSSDARVFPRGLAGMVAGQNTVTVGVIYAFSTAQ